MALSPRSESEMKKKSQDLLKITKDPVERLRLRCLARGAHGIKGLARTFKIMDDDRSKTLSYTEFRNGLNDFGLIMSKEEVQELFSKLDRNSGGSIDFDEFLEALRPPMSERRKRLIEMAFTKMDITNDGKITVHDLQRVYNVKQHKKYQSGEWSATQCQEAFINSFDTNNKDGIVTKEEFLNYYAAVSASIDQDPYFDLMMRNAYSLE